MTSAGSQRKRQCAAAAFAALGMILGVPSFGLQSRAATTEQLILDLHTGFAIGGVDPVAYFTEGKPQAGRVEFEYNLRGTTWRFRNEGNRAAFAADPKVYMPQFGGYDPIALARGVATAGYPQYWLIHDKRLYLFYTPQARAAFAADPDNALEEASAKWPEVLRTLSP
jgi:hypothetical protein